LLLFFTALAKYRVKVLMNHSYLQHIDHNITAFHEFLNSSSNHSNTHLHHLHDHHHHYHQQQQQNQHHSESLVHHQGNDADQNHSYSHNITDLHPHNDTSHNSSHPHPHHLHHHSGHTGSAFDNKWRFNNHQHHQPPSPTPSHNPADDVNRYRGMLAEINVCFVDATFFIVPR
jgi:hypothetical protein